MEELQREVQIGETAAERRCKKCGDPVTVKRPNQQYCSGRCRRAALMRRKRAREVVQLPAQINPMDAGRLLQEAQEEREEAGKERLQSDPYLEARAALIEAEWQVRDWAARLKTRREHLEKLKEPPVDRKVQRLNRTEVLTVPDNALSVGIVTTDGCLGVAVYGVRR